MACIGTMCRHRMATILFTALTASRQTTFGLSVGTQFCTGTAPIGTLSRPQTHPMGAGIRAHGTWLAYRYAPPTMYGQWVVASLVRWGRVPPGYITGMAF